MNPEKFDLSKLRIASPCSVSWNNMYGDERTRFCAACKLNVYNVAGMTEAEVRELISRAEGRVCMRLMRRVDGSVITQDCPVGLRAYRKRFARFAGATMAAMLGLFSISYAQKEDKDTIDASKLKIVHVTNDCSGEITGTILDPAGAVVEKARIVIFDNQDKELKELASSISNENGDFRVPHLPRGEYKLTVTSPGFKLLAITNIRLSGVECLKFDLTLKVGDIMGVVIEASSDEIIGTSEASLSNTIDVRKIEELPLSSRQILMGLVAIPPKKDSTKSDSKTKQ